MCDLISLKKSDLRWFDLAKQEAGKSSFPRFKVGCVVVYNGYVLATGHNSSKSDTLQKKYNYYRRFNNYNTGVMVQHSLHAEIAALKSIPYPIKQETDWKKVKVYTYRIAPGLPHQRGLSRPCLACMEYIKELGIRKIYYATDSGFAAERIDD